MKSANILYMPALHQGYINFLEGNESAIGLLDQSLVLHTPRLERDIRAIGANVMMKVVESIFPDRPTTVLSEENVDEFIDDFTLFRLPDEDVSHTFADEYLGRMDVEFERTFLRWDRPISMLETAVPFGRVVSFNELDQSIIRDVSEEGQRSPDWWRQVGAAIYINGKRIIVTHNHPYPTEHGTLEIFGDPRSNFDAGQNIDLQKNVHAEADAIAQAARDGISLRGGDLYVSTFPCPPCAKLVAISGIKRVYYRDGYSLLDAEDILKSQGVEIILVKDN